jgi:hypothetical protein
MDQEHKVDNLTNIRLTPRQRKNEERKRLKALFLESLRSDPSISRAVDHANISRGIVYKWREEDSQFAKDWDEALERTKDVARSSIYQRGIIGWLEPLVSNGQLVCEEKPLFGQDGNPVFDKRGKVVMIKGDPKMVRKYSDSLASLYAKANLPEYKDKQQIEHSGSISGQVAVYLPQKQSMDEMQKGEDFSVNNSNF